MKRGKSAGDDELPADIIKNRGECVLHELLKIFNAAYTSDSVPVGWQKGMICPLLKKREKVVFDNYRG